MYYRQKIAPTAAANISLNLNSIKSIFHLLHYIFHQCLDYTIIMSGLGPSDFLTNFPIDITRMSPPFFHTLDPTPARLDPLRFHHNSSSVLFIVPTRIVRYDKDVWCTICMQILNPKSTGHNVVILLLSSF